MEQIAINKIKPNPDNPRVITDEKFKKLVKSIKEFPEMLNVRPIVVNSDMVVLGGNMRLKACKEAGLKKVPVEIAKGFTKEEQDEFVVKDNTNFGDWDNSKLNKFDSPKLADWGLITFNPMEQLEETHEAPVYEQPEEVDVEDIPEHVPSMTMLIEFNISDYDEAHNLVESLKEQEEVDFEDIIFELFTEKLEEVKDGNSSK